MNFIELKCSNCGANLKLDLENLQSFCHYCGNKLLISIDDLSKVLVEKEKTKRTELVNEHELKRQKQDFKEFITTLILCFGILFGIMIFSMIMSHLGK